MQPRNRQIHVCMLALPWRCGPQGCQCNHSPHQNQAHGQFCRLVSHWFQGKLLSLKNRKLIYYSKLQPCPALGWNQLSTTDGCARRRFGQGEQSRLLPGQYNLGIRGLGKTRS